MFDLDERIAAWRSSIAASLGDQKDVLDELESHLREQLHRLALEGMPANEAWERALERLGPPQQLAAEFGKNETAQPLRWIAAWLVFSLYSLAFVGFGLLLTFETGLFEGLLGLHVFTVTMGYSAVLSFGALVIWSFLARTIRGWDARNAARLQWWAQRFHWASLLLISIGVVTGSLWAKENLGRFWTWDPREIGGAAAIVWNVVALAQMRRPNRTGTTGWILGLVGNIVVCCAWIGANLLGTGLHGYGAAPLVGLFWVFIAVHAIFVAVVLTMPERPSNPLRHT